MGRDDATKTAAYVRQSVSPSRSTLLEKPFAEFVAEGVAISADQNVPARKKHHIDAIRGLTLIRGCSGCQEIRQRALL